LLRRTTSPTGSRWWYPNGKRCSEPAYFKTPGIGIWKIGPAEKRERPLKSDGWTFERFGPGRNLPRVDSKLAVEPLCPKAKPPQKGRLDRVFHHAYLTI